MSGCLCLDVTQVPEFLAQQSFPPLQGVYVGESRCSCQVGQPSTGAPAKVKEAAAAALVSDRLAYTGALGLPALREKLAASYMER